MTYIELDSERKRTRTRIDGMKEIGSDFWKAELKKNDIRFFLSGRTALEYIIRDICTDTVFDSVLLPSYCCHTMIEPFVRHGMDIRFYDVYYSQGKLCADIPEPQKREIFFLIEYFGYSKLFGIYTQSVELCCRRLYTFMAYDEGFKRILRLSVYKLSEVDRHRLYRNGRKNRRLFSYRETE